MTDDELNEIKARLEVYQQSGFAPLEEEFTALLAEVEQWRAIGRVVARGTMLTYDRLDITYVCALCSARSNDTRLDKAGWPRNANADWVRKHLQHTDKCPVTKARALLEGTANHDG